MTTNRRDLALGATVILALTILIYLPSLAGGFIWDDDVMLTGNPLIKAADGLRAIWFSTTLPDYFPLTSTTFWLEWRVWGMNPFGYHLTNVLLHAINAVLLWRALARLRIAGAWLVAVVWAIHPVSVASVAWVAERKNTLSMLFYLLSILWYLKSEARLPEARANTSTSPPRNQGSGTAFAVRPWLLAPHTWYWLSVLAFLLALLSKTSVVALPLVLLLCAWWQRGHISSQDLQRSVPFFALALLLGLVTVWFQSYRGLGAGIASGADSRGVRLLGGTWAIWQYLLKAVAPVNLMMIYPRWRINPCSILTYVPGLTLLGLGGLFWSYRKSWGRALLFALGYYVVTLAPVLGAFDMGFLTYSRMADHWHYLPLIGVVGLVVGGAAYLVQTQLKALARWTSLCGAAGLIILLSVLTWRHERVFASSERLWRDTLARNPNAWVAHESLGVSFILQGQVAEAIAEFREALGLDPNAQNVHYNLANALSQQGKWDEAISHYKEALRLNPKDVWSHHNLANALNMQGKYAEAADHCRAALKINPNNANIQDTMGNALFGEGNLPGAEQHYSTALAINPNHASAHDHLGRLLARQGDLTNAILQFVAAMQVEPDQAEAHLDLGKALSALGQLDQATDQYTTALQLQPQMAEVHYSWALLCLKKHEPSEAARHYREALRLRPDYPDALNNLAWLLATSPDPELRNGRQAVRLAAKACELTGRKEARFLGTLDAAYAETGQFAEAIAAARQARDLALSAGQPDLAGAALRRLRDYEMGRPYRQAQP